MNQRKAEPTQIDPEVQDHIGRQLRAGYVDILNQPVPDRFLELLAELDQKEGGFGDPQGGRHRNGAR